MIITLKTLACLVLLFVYRTEAAVYLKPTTTDIRVLEGHDLKLTWLAYDEDERLPPCYWEYASNKSARPIVFMAFEDGERHEYGDTEPWQFTKTQEPCKGGIRKEAKSSDSGVYTMLLESGYRLKKEDSQITVHVYPGRDLWFLITLNDNSMTFDLSEKNVFNLTKLQTSEPIDISVKLSNAFPPTRIIITRDVYQLICDGSSDDCSKRIDLTAAIDAPIVVRMETGIVGIDTVAIYQPVSYYVPVDNTYRDATIALGILFSVCLIVLIIILVLLVLRNRKTHKMNEGESESEPNQNPSKLQRMKNRMQNVGRDFILAFQGNQCTNQHGIISKLKAEVEQKEKEIKNSQQKMKNNLDQYETEKKKVTSSISEGHTSVEEALSRCTKVEDALSKVHKSSSGESKSAELYLESVSDLENYITSIGDDLNRYEALMKECESQKKDAFEKMTRMDKANKDSGSSVDDVEQGENVSEDEPKETDKMNKSEVDSSHEVIKLLKTAQHQQSKIVTMSNCNLTLEMVLSNLSWLQQCSEALNGRLKKVKDRITKAENYYSRIK